MGSKETLVLAILCLLFSRVGWTLTNLVLFEPIARGTGGRQPPAGCGAGPAGGRVWTRRGWGWCCFCFLPQRGVGGVAAPRLTLPPKALHLARCGRVFAAVEWRRTLLRPVRTRTAKPGVRGLDLALSASARGVALVVGVGVARLPASGMDCAAVATASPWRRTRMAPWCYFSLVR